MFMLRSGVTVFLVSLTWALSSNTFSERSDLTNYVYHTDNQKRGISGLYENVLMEADEGEMLLERHRRENIGQIDSLTTESVTPAETVFLKDNHDYYKARYITGNEEAMKWWVDIEKYKDDINIHQSLSSSERRAVNMQLNMNFLFYGHKIDSATIATGGFIYVGQHIHPYLAATQYIAPLMANFDLSASNSSQVRSVQKESLFTVQWDNVQMKNNAEDGNFTFQLTLHNDSKIVFVYKEVPTPVSSLPSTYHPVKVGVADAYYTDTYIQPPSKKYIRRQINQYHAVELDKARVVSSSAIILDPLPTCNIFKDCDTCEQSKIPFNCTWCPALQACSDGFDRNRQEWMENNCQDRWTDSPCVSTTTQATQVDKTQPTQQANVASTDSSDSAMTTGKSAEATSPVVTTDKSPTSANQVTDRKTTKSSTSTLATTSVLQSTLPALQTSSGVTATEKTHTLPLTGHRPGEVIMILVPVIIVILIICAVVWVCYAYKYPMSKSGLLLIQIQRSHSNRKNNRSVKYKYRPTVGISSIKDDIDI